MIAEIYCSICHGYNTVEIPSHMNGFHIITCGKCGHKHYRCIKDSAITDKRYSKHVLSRLSLRIFTYKGNWKAKSWEKNPFLSELWAGKAMQEVS